MNTNTNTPTDSGRQLEREKEQQQQQLTQKNLALLNKLTGSGTASTLSGCEMASSSVKVSTTSSGFAIQAEKNGILNHYNSKPPQNINNIRKRYTASRATNSPTQSDFDGYNKTVIDCPNEATTAATFQDYILQKCKHDQGYRSVLDQAFTAFPQDIIGLNKGLPAPKPDFIQGLVMDQYQPTPIHEIDGAILYEDKPASITLPHIAGEWKRLGGDLRVAEMQASYDGAVLTYARNQALGRMSTTDAPEHAHVTTFTSDGRFLDIYAHHADAEGRYHHHRVAAADMVSYQGFKDGYRMLRNAQDHAKEESFRLRDRLCNHYRQEEQGLDASMCSERQEHAQAGCQAQRPLSTTAAPSLTVWILAGACLFVWPALFLIFCIVLVATLLFWR